MAEKSSDLELQSAMDLVDDEAQPKKKKFQCTFPTAYTILFVLTIVIAILTYVVPAGNYDRVLNEELGRNVPVPGTYHRVEQTPQGPFAVFLAPIDGFYDHITYEAQSIDVGVFILMIGGFLGVVNSTGAIEAGIEKVMRVLVGRELWMIPILMALFAAGGTVFGMAEECLAFVKLLCPVMIKAGFDPLTGAMIALLGAGVGTLGSTINPFATVIASNAAGIPFTQGIIGRVIMLLTNYLITVAYVMYYARRIKRNPEKSVTYKNKAEIDAFFLGDEMGQETERPLTLKRILVLLVFLATFAVMIVGVVVLHWWMGELAALFLFASIVAGIVSLKNEPRFIHHFISGAADMVGVAIVIAISRGIVIIMDRGNITDTVLNFAEGAVTGLSSVAFIMLLYLLLTVLAFLVPSSSGLATLTMPIMAPLADFAGVERALVITTYQAAFGWINLWTVTSAVIMGGLSLARVGYASYMKVAIPYLIFLYLFDAALLCAYTALHFTA